MKMEIEAQKDFAKTIEKSEEENVQGNEAE